MGRYFLKTGRQVGNLLRRQVDGGEVRLLGSADGITHRRLHSAEAEVEFGAGTRVTCLNPACGRIPRHQNWR